MIIPRVWLLLSVPVLGLTAWLLVKTALHLARVMRASVVARVPVRAEQIVDLPSTGDFVVSVEQRWPARAGGDLRVALTRVDGGAVVRVDPVMMAAEIRSGSRARRAIASCTIAQPGKYVLRLAPDFSGGPDAMIVIGPPVGCTIVIHVLALLVLGFAAIGAMIVTTGAITGTPFVSSTTTSG